MPGFVQIFTQYQILRLIIFRIQPVRAFELGFTDNRMCHKDLLSSARACTCSQEVAIKILALPASLDGLFDRTPTSLSESFKTTGEPLKPPVTAPLICIFFLIPYCRSCAPTTPSA